MAARARAASVLGQPLAPRLHGAGARVRRSGEAEALVLAGLDLEDQGRDASHVHLGVVEGANQAFEEVHLLRGRQVDLVVGESARRLVAEQELGVVLHVVEEDVTTATSLLTRPSAYCTDRRRPWFGVWTSFINASFASSDFQPRRIEEGGDTLPVSSSPAA